MQLQQIVDIAFVLSNWLFILGSQVVKMNLMRSLAIIRTDVTCVSLLW